ncbi:hypothetical protein JMUB6875_13670 [Nocardia sp. JMUB6875]
MGRASDARIPIAPTTAAVHRAIEPLYAAMVYAHTTVPYGNAGSACVHANTVIAVPTAAPVANGARRRHINGADAATAATTTHHGRSLPNWGATVATVTRPVTMASTIHVGTCRTHLGARRRRSATEATS